jgi:hypothetical protein
MVWILPSCRRSSLKWQTFVPGAPARHNGARYCSLSSLPRSGNPGAARPQRLPLDPAVAEVTITRKEDRLILSRALEGSPRRVVWFVTARCTCGGAAAGSLLQVVGLEYGRPRAGMTAAGCGHRRLVARAEPPAGRVSRPTLRKRPPTHLLQRFMLHIIRHMPLPAVVVPR